MSDKKTSNRKDVLADALRQNLRKRKDVPVETPTADAASDAPAPRLTPVNRKSGPLVRRPDAD